GNSEAAQVLFHKGASINAIIVDGSYLGSTPLHIACLGTKAEIAQLLLDRGANISLVPVASQTSWGREDYKKRVMKQLPIWKEGID
ncbi:hypothetical protein BJ878DRAFT_416156, partial [Calycina marina]